MGLRFNIRARVTVSFFIIGLLMIISSLNFMRSITYARKTNTYLVDYLLQEKSLIQELKTSMLKSSTNIYQFLETNNIAKLESATRELESMSTNINSLVQMEYEQAELLDRRENDSDIALYNGMIMSNESFNDAIIKIIDIAELRGFSNDDGYLGDYRQALSALEGTVASTGNTALSRDYYQLRVLSQQYLLKVDQGIFEDYKSLIDKMENRNGSYGLSNRERQELSAVMNRFDTAYRALSDSEKKIKTSLDQVIFQLERQGRDIDDKIESVKEELKKTQIELQTSVAKSMMTSIIAVFFAIILEIIIGLLISRNIKIPVKDLLEKTRLIADGDFTPKDYYSKNDEFGAISTALQEATDQLRRFFIKVQDSTNKNFMISENLSDATKKSSSSVTNIKSHIESISEKLHALKFETMETKSSATNILNKSEELGQLLQEQSTAMTETSTATEQMIANISNVTDIAKTKGDAVKGLLNITKEGQNQVHITNQLAQEIEVYTTDILSITEMINDIASNTDLLAMNAAIEAAHAGDAGKGFAVVAEEIRKLAESSAANANRINDMLQLVSEKIIEVSRSSQESTFSLEKINSEVTVFANALSEIIGAMSEMSLGSREVLNSTETIAKNTETIKSSTQEIVRNIRQISTLFQDVDTMTTDVDGGLKEILNDTVDLNTDLKTVSFQCQENEESIRELNKELSFFHVDSEKETGLPVMDSPDDSDEKEPIS